MFAIRWWIFQFGNSWNILRIVWFKFFPMHWAEVGDGSAVTLIGFFAKAWDYEQLYFRDDCFYSIRGLQGLLCVLGNCQQGVGSYRVLTAVFMSAWMRLYTVRIMQWLERVHMVVLVPYYFGLLFTNDCFLTHSKRVIFSRDLFIYNNVWGSGVICWGSFFLGQNIIFMCSLKPTMAMLNIYIVDDDNWVYRILISLVSNWICRFGVLLSWGVPLKFTLIYQAIDEGRCYYATSLLKYL